jgi:hypothetical protein
MSNKPAPLRRAALLALAVAFGGVALTAGPATQRAAAQQSPQSAAPVADDDRLSQPQLEQLLAPIALFPDELLMQVLMAATYPLEVVSAQRWLRQGQNAALAGDALATALQAQPWDPSVKSLVPFPDVLRMLYDELEWTQLLGDTVLAQQEDVLNTVQVLRGRALAAGNLQSSAEQTVTVTQSGVAAEGSAAALVAPVVAPPPQVIVIAPAQPNVVFVPVYNPTVAFGTWPHPTYPPPHYGLGNALLTGMAFAAGAAIVGSLWGWASPGWGRGSVNVNVNRFNSINVNRTQINSNTWRHDVTHRGGVAYRNTQVNNIYRGGSNVAIRADSREQFRGRVQQVERGGNIGDLRPGDGNRPNLGENRPGGADRPNLGANRPGDANRPNLGENRPGGVDRPNLGANRPDGATRPNLGENRPGGADRPNLGSNRPDGAPRPGGGDSRPTPGANRPAGAERPNIPERAPAAAQRPSVGHTPAGRPAVAPSRPSGGGAPPAMQGMGQGRDVRAASQRGAASRQAQPAARAQARPAAANRAAPARQGGGAHGGGGHGGGRRG